MEEDDPETQDADGAGTTTSGMGTTSAPPGGPTGNTTGPGGNGSAPTAGLSASPLEGEAPLNVTFTVAGSADGDAISWTLALDNATIGNGTTLPSNVTHQFTQAGNFTVVLTVTDGTSNATANVTVAVTAAGAEEPSDGPTEDDWVVFNADGTCDAKGEFGAVVYVHERGDPPGTGFAQGDGTWVYEESNDISGLQVGGPDDPAYSACLNPDTLIF